MQINTSNFNFLPDELLLKVFNYCSDDYKLLLRIGAVCKRWRSVASDDVLWCAHREKCLQMRLLKKSWSEITLCLGKEPNQVKIREVMIDCSKKIHVLFADGSLYHLTRQGTLLLRHQFNKDTPTAAVELFLGGRINYSTAGAFSIARYREGGQWVRGHRDLPGYYESTSFAHHLRLLGENGETLSEMPMFHDTMTEIASVNRIEQFGRYILACGFKGTLIGNRWNDNLSPNVIWKIKANTDGNYANRLKPVHQLSLSERAILIDGLFVDILDDQKVIKLVNFVANPLQDKPSTSSCTIM